ncbi:DUF4143 domain-containing protein [candidate division CSSED10-310 bacterium]|uniref:DUF4143 domain-containing protein n=1 Tax=candidate division CSSED10-310 bacterium TaxID=2855610 RepID=A0ABV6Z447_UNCC1
MPPLPYYPNIKKRFIKSPKIYIRDSGLLHALLNIVSLDELSGHPILGHSWEGFIIEQIIYSLPDLFRSFFLRTNAGAEIDLIILKPHSELIAVEVKYTASPKASRGFINLLQDLNCISGMIIYPGEEEYPVHRNIKVTPLTHFLAMLDQQQ